MSVARAPLSKWDLERFVYTDPALSTTERWVAVQILKTLDNKLRPVNAGLMSQTLIGYRLHKRRESVNRALRKLVVLGYFRTRWITVQRATAQGVKGVTRVLAELGPVLAGLVEKRRSRDAVSAGKPRGVTSPHPSPTPPGHPGTVSGSVIANSADRKGEGDDSARFKRETLDQWPRLAGSRPKPTPAPPRFAELELRTDGAELDSATQMSGDEYEARVAAARERQRLAELARRNQPRRLPRSRR